MSTSAHPAPDSMGEPNAEPDDGSPRRKLEELVASSGLPDATRELILRIVKRTRLTRREKVGVAIELIAHFGDGLDAGISIDDLTAGFGDEVSTAKLIRRAKLRCRSWLSKTIRRLTQASAILIVFYIGAFAYYAMGRANVAVDYLAKANKVALAVPEAERAWPIYREALLELDRDRAGKVLNMKGLYPTGESWDEAAKLLMDSQPTLITARRASAMSHLGYVRTNRINDEDRELWPKQYEAAAKSSAEGNESALAQGAESPDTFVMSTQLPHMAELRRLARVLQLDALHAAELGDGDRVAADLAGMLGMARQFHQSPTLIEKLVATDMAMNAVEVAAGLLTHFRDVLSDAHLRQLAHGFAREDVVPIMDAALDRGGFYDLVQRMYTDDGNGDGHLTSNGIRLAKGLGALTGSNGPDFTFFGDPVTTNFFSASRKEVTAEYDQVTDRYDAMAGRPFWETRGDDAIETWDLMSDEKKLSDRYWLVAIIVPALDDVYLTHQNAVGRRDGLLIAIALELYRRRHGDYPKSLDQLSPDLLPNVPRDRFTGATMGYQVKDDQVVVYSVGRDRDDDGGVLPTVAQAIPPSDQEELPYQREERLKHIRNLESGSWIERRPHLTRVVSPNPRVVVSGPRLKEFTNPPDGDWVLWYSAGWPVERDAAKSKSTDVWAAAAKGDKPAIEKQLAAGIDINGTDPIGGSTPLMLASMCGHSEIAQWLIDKGAQVDATNGTGDTALHGAAFLCHPEVIRLLIENGCDVNRKNKRGETPLDSMTRKWNQSLRDLYAGIGAILQTDVDIDRIERVRSEVAELIRKNGGKQNPDLDVFTAAMTGQIAIVEKYLAAGNDIEARSPLGCRLLFHAAALGQTDIVRLLVERGADLDAQDGQWPTALAIAADFCQGEVVELLLENGADLSLKVPSGENVRQTALESVTEPWSEEMAGGYFILGAIFHHSFDLERIERDRPVIAELLRQGDGEQAN